MKKIGRSFFALLLSNFIFFISSYLIYFGLARILAPEEFGVYGVVISLMSIIVIIFVNGLQQTVSKFVSEKEELAEIIKRKALLFQLIVGSITTLIYFLASPLIALALNDSSLTPFIQLSSLIIFFHSLYAVFIGYFNGLKQFKKQAILQGTYSVVKLLLILALVLFGFGLFGAIGGFVFASFFAFLISFAFAGRKKLKGRFAVKKLAFFAFPLMVFSLITNLLLNISLLSVKALSQAKFANIFSAYYTAAFTVSQIPYFITISIIFLIFPLISTATFSKDFAKAKNYIKKTLKYSLLVLIPVVFLIASTSKELIVLLYSSKYAFAGPILFILAFAFGFYSLFLILCSIISASGRAKTSMFFAFSVLVLLIILNFVLIPLQSLVGAATATFIALFFGMLLSLLFVFAKFKAMLKVNSFLKILCAGLIVFLFSVLFPVSGLMLLLKYVFLLCLYIVVLILLKELRQKDIKVFLHIFGV